MGVNGSNSCFSGGEGARRQGLSCWQVRKAGSFLRFFRMLSYSRIRQAINKNRLIPNYAFRIDLSLFRYVPPKF